MSYNCTLLLTLALPIPTKTTTTTKLTTAKTNSKTRHISPRILLWGQSLPPQLLISTVRSTWSAAWHLVMSQLAPSNPIDRYTRPTSQFRSTQFFRKKPGILHLYGLKDAVSVSVASPELDGSWEFRHRDIPDGDRVVPGLDNANGRKTLRQVYRLRRWGYDSRSTVSMLLDVERKEVVCNESYDIIELFNLGLNRLAKNPDLDLSLPSLKKKIKDWNQIIYSNVNNGVYRFAQSQQAYDSIVNELFSTLDMVDDHLGSFRYLCGDVLTLADICLFTTLIRFDLVYNVLFKCTKRKLIEYPNLHAYMRDIHQIPKIATTCNFGAVMDGYYNILFSLNPSSIRPAMLSRPKPASLLSADKNV
ncbi:hypothetical protein CsSME_00045340 [Camellia sinensis var. sinensis]